MPLTTIGTAAIDDNAITTAKIAADTVVAADIAANAITASELADDAVDTDAVANLAVTTAKIAADAIDGTKLADNAVTLAKLEDGTQGDILYYGASGAPARLGFGTSGYFLKTQGTGADPVWAASTVADGSITNAKMADMAANTVKVRDANSSGVPSDKALATTEILIGDGTGFTAASLSGDVTMTNAGAVTIATDAVDIAMLSATGTADATTFLRGDNAWASAAAGLNSVQTFTSSGTWTRPSGITKVIMEVQGGGGRGGNGDGSYNGGGAGAGGYARKFLDVSSISTSTITVGAGATSSSTDGGDSSWADGTNTITANGGEAGAGAAGGSGIHGHGKPGGTATGGDINITGQGGSGIVENEMGGGNSFFGFGATHTGAINTASYDGVAGLGYGSGGSGCTVSNGTGGNGANGVVIVWEYK